MIFLVFLLILQQVEGNLIYPRVVGSSIGLPPLWTLFAVVFWGGVLGIPGILFGTPATAVLYRLFRSSVRARLRTRAIDPKNPSLPKRKAPEKLPNQRMRRAIWRIESKALQNKSPSPFWVGGFCFLKTVESK